MRRDDQRGRDLGRIHALKRDGGLDDEDYRALIGLVCPGHDSAATLDQAGRSRLIGELVRFAQDRQKPAVRQKKHSFPYAMTRQLTKARAIWIELARAGVIEDGRDSALAKFIQRQTGGVRIGRLTSSQGSKVIDGLKEMARRHKILGTDGTTVRAALKTALKTDGAA